MIKKIISAYGTVNTISFFDGSRGAADQAEQMISDMNARWSVFAADSEISLVNRFAGQKYVAVAPDTYDILKKSVGYSTLTNGIFDITIQPVIEYYKTESRGIFSYNNAIGDLLALVNYKDILFCDNSYEVKLKNHGQKISLGAVAKGYAADKVTAFLRQNNISEAVINLGGTVSVIGSERKIGLQHPLKKTGQIMGELTLKDKIAVTSGIYEQQCFINGNRWHHILDPRTGRPSKSDLLSVTLVGENGATLDALATAVIILGLEQGYEIIGNLGLQAVFVTDKLNVIATDGLQNNFKLTREATV